MPDTQDAFTSHDFADISAQLSALGSIDTDKLYDELTEFASLYGVHAAIALHSAAKVDRAKRKLDEVEALVDQTVRQNAAVRGDKITEKAVASMLATDPTCIDARTALFNAEMEHEHAKASLKVLDKKERMLDLIARLTKNEIGVINRTA